MSIAGGVYFRSCGIPGGMLIGADTGGYFSIDVGSYGERMC